MQVTKIVRIPTGACGLSEPFGIKGYRVAAIRVPGGWATANITFRGSPYLPPAVTQVVPTGINAGLAVDANAYDIQMTNPVRLQRHRNFYHPAKVDPIDVSALLAAPATIDQNDHGILWVFQHLTDFRGAGVIALEVDKDASDYTSAIAAWAQYSKPTRALPPLGLYVPIGAVHVTEGGSGAFTWGTDSITAETEAYHNFVGLPEVLVREDGTLALDAGAATFTYGAVTARLGTGARIVATGKVNVAITGSNVAAGKVGVWLLYLLADDVEYALQLGEAYDSLAEAQAAVIRHNPNPMLPVFAAMYVQNASAGAFEPGVTFLDAADITTTFQHARPRFDNIYDDTGTEVVVTAAEDRLVILGGDAKEVLTQSATLQFRSGTSATPVDQTTSPDLEVILESV